MKLWEKGYSINNIVERFTVGNDRNLDIKLAKHEINGSIAHAKMLHKISILSDLELKDILFGLNKIKQTIENKTFTIEDKFEDIHSKVEFELFQLIGESGKKIHTARSRNDQVLLDLHLYVKEEISTIKLLVKSLFHTFICLSEKHKSILMPGYTHLQIAMPSSFGLWFSGYAESLIDDLILLNAAQHISNQNPLGSGAGYGTSLPIDRTMTTKILGFEDLKYSVVAAQMSRGKLEKTTAFSISSLAYTLSKFSSDICLYMSQNFNFLSFPKELTTGSSIMPHKQNPDVFEMMRAKCNQLQNIPAEITLITNNLTSGYHRDFQILKGVLMNGIDVLKDNLEVCNFMLQHVIVKESILDDPIYDYLFSVEEVNKYVLKGYTFRDAYQKISKDILDGSFIPKKNNSYTHEGSIGNLCLDKIRLKFEKYYS
jgi:argininosuccinate lyase